MRFREVRLAAIGADIPDEIWSSADIERRMAALYRRLKLPEGRLEGMSGVVERRVWPEQTLPGTPSIQTARRTIEASGIDPGRIGALIHASVCRDFLEPATASRVHHGLGLRPDCCVYDVSNACLGILNGAVQIAGLIDAGVIEAGLVVGTENARPLLTQTIEHLNANEALTRKTVKPAFASLTIGSGSAAWLLCKPELAPDATRCVAATVNARTQFHDLCRSDTDTGGASMQPLMETDSERLMAEGIACGAANFGQLLETTAWPRESIAASVCHQVGGRHRVAMLQAMGLPLERDHITFDRLGNTGSVALPMTLAHAASKWDVDPDARVVLLGIGSGINSVMMGVQWGQTAIVPPPLDALQSSSRVPRE